MLEMPLRIASQIEVSGWDAADKFFVERTKLEPGEEDCQFVCLQHAVDRGAVVFLRAVDSVQSPRHLPIACRAESVDPADRQGLSRIALVRLRPKQSGGSERINVQVRAEITSQK